MHLGNAGRAQSLLIYVVENLLPAPFIFFLNNVYDRFKGQGQSLGLKLHQLLAVLRRQKIRAHAHNLAQLHKSRPQILKYCPDLLRGHAAHHLMLAQHPHHFPEARRSARIFNFSLKKTLEHQSTPLQGTVHK